MNKMILLLVGSLCFISAGRATDPIKFATYCNARFDYCVDYPSDLFFPAPESTNGDGRTFSDEYGRTVLTVYGIRNENFDDNATVDTVSIQKEYQSTVDDYKQNDGTEGEITYKKLGRNFFVISGRWKHMIFYQKTIAKEGYFCHANLEYADRDSLLYDSISTRIFKSFK